MFLVKHDLGMFSMVFTFFFFFPFGFRARTVSPQRS